MQLSDTTMADTHAAYVQSLVDRINKKHDEWKAQNYGLPKSAFLRDFRTVGIHTPRQSNGYWWFEQLFYRTPESIMLVRGEAMKRHVCEVGQGVCPGRTFFVYTYAEYIKGISEQTIRPRPEATFIEDSTLFFSRVRMNKFYSWLSQHVSSTHTVYKIN